MSIPYIHSRTTFIWRFPYFARSGYTFWLCVCDLLAVGPLNKRVRILW